MTTSESIRETVRKRYAAAATRSAARDQEKVHSVETSCCGGASVAATDEQGRAGETSCCGGAPVATTDERGRVVFGADLYNAEAAEGAPTEALAASLGCGVPTAVADLHPGEVVLDLGSGAGADVLISARRVAPGGRAIGLDMTTEMLDLARANASRAGVDNVEFLQGYLEDIPLPDDSVDVVISNCVLNLAADKNVVLAEVARVLRRGGRLAFSDVIADDDMDESTKADMVEWTGCIAGALTQTELIHALTAAGFSDLEIRPTHRVHAHAQAAIIRASLARSEAHAPGQGASSPVGDETASPAGDQTASPAGDQTASPAGDQTASPAGDQMERNPMTTTMTATIEVFDPAMCCSTGVCGPSVDPQLARFEADLRWLAARGAHVTRYNLAQEPGEFVARPVVAAMLASGGEEALPIILVDGKIRFSGTWPSRTDLASPSGIEVPVEHANLLAPAENACCTLTDRATTGCCAPSEREATGCCAPGEQAGDACCTPTEKESTGCCSSADRVGEPQVAHSVSCC